MSAHSIVIRRGVHEKTKITTSVPGPAGNYSYFSLDIYSTFVYINISNNS